MNPSTIHYLTQAELQRLLGVIESKRDKAIFYTAFIYGLRASEVGMLQRSDIDLQRKRIRITRLKSSVSGELMLKPEISKLITAYLRTRTDEDSTLFTSNRGHPIARRTLVHFMHTYAKKAKSLSTPPPPTCAKPPATSSLCKAGWGISPFKTRSSMPSCWALQKTHWREAPLRVRSLFNTPVV